MVKPKYDAVFRYRGPEDLEITIAEARKYDDLIAALEYSGMFTYLNKFPSRLVVRATRNPCWTVEHFEEEISTILSRSVGIHSIGGIGLSDWTSPELPEASEASEAEDIYAPEEVN